MAVKTNLKIENVHRFLELAYGYILLHEVVKNQGSIFIPPCNRYPIIKFFMEDFYYLGSLLGHSEKNAYSWVEVCDLLILIREHAIDEMREEE